MPGGPGKWWCLCPFATSSLGVLTQALNAVSYQPFWIGPCAKFMQVQIALPVVADTAGNVVSAALYADRGDLWPGALIQVLGDMATTTVVGNTSKTLSNLNVTVTPNAVYWMALMPKGGVLPNLRNSQSGYTLLGLPDTTFVRTNAPSVPYNMFVQTTSDGIFPATAGDETVLLPSSPAPRVNWYGQ